LFAFCQWRSWGFGLAVVAASGCSAWKPLEGVPSNYYPQELDGEMRSSKQTIDLSLLRQTPPPSYLLDTGDTLGIVIEGVLGRPEDVPPVYYPTDKDVAPSIGYPIPVREDGTISLPYAAPIYVRGLSIRQTEELIRKTYTVDKQILRQGEDRILVALQRPRFYNVLVIRQEAQGQELTPQAGQAGTLLPGLSKRGTGKLVALQAYKNDVLHALAQTGGLPGLDAENTIYVIRRRTGGTSDLPQDYGPQEQLMPAFQPQTPPGFQGQLWPQSQQTRPAQGAIQPIAHFESGNSPATTHADGVEWQNVVEDAPPAEGREIRQAQSEQGLYLPEPTPVPNTAPGVDGHRGFAPPAAAPYSHHHSAPPAGHGGPGHGVYGAFPPAGQLPLEPIPHGQPGHAPPLMPPGIPEGLPSEYAAMVDRGAQVIRIPIRLGPGESPLFSELDVILQEGDIVFIESRDTEVFYTGGLLGGGQHMLPRDYDIDIIEAIAISTGRNQGGGGAGFGNPIGGVSALSRDITVGASDVVILRKAGDGQLIPIRVNLNRADRDPKHRVRILPGDYIVLQYKPHEAVAAFVERNLLAGGLISLAAFGNGGGNN
jgi:hypothetical protein